MTLSELDARKAGLREYFGPKGFERWRTIYGSGKVSAIRRTVRNGHAAMVAQALAWAWEDGVPARVLDAGCGPGMVSLALARAGSNVVGCDLSDQMVEYARSQAEVEPSAVAQRLSFVSSDLETVAQKVSNSFDLTICLDVLIYYPETEFSQIVQKLAALSPKRIIFTYAPATLLLKTMHRIGRAFPKTQRATSLEIIGMRAVQRGLTKAGLQLNRQREFNKGFYHVVLAEAVNRG
jgi:magnesium-protoporphyrin O-methyltransferase